MKFGVLNLSESSASVRRTLLASAGKPLLGAPTSQVAAKPDCFLPARRLAWQDSEMSQGFGIELPREHDRSPHRKPVRYLVVIHAAESTVARLFLETRELVAEFDAGAEEVALATRGLKPVKGAQGPEWATALAGLSAIERGEADVYTLDV